MNCTYNDVDTTHLLGNHHGERCQSRTSNSGDSEKLNETCYIVGLLNQCLFELDLCVDVVQIASSLKFGVSKSLE